MSNVAKEGAGDRQDVFFLDQRSEIIGIMSGNVKVLARTIKQIGQRLERKRRREQNAEGTPEPTTLASSSDRPAEPADAYQDLDPGPAKTARLDLKVTLTFSRHIISAAPILDVADRFRLTIS